MIRPVAYTLIYLLAFNNLLSAQQASAPAPATAPAPAPTSTAPATSASVDNDAKLPRSAVPGTLMDGTVVKLRLAETISSADAQVGQQVLFEVTEDVDVDGVKVIAKGGQAIATVTEARSKKSMGRGGKLNVNIDSVRLVDGESAQLRAIRENKGGGHVGAMTGAMVATSIVFFPAAPLFLFIKGKDITIPKGTEVTAFAQGDMKLDMAKFGAAPASSPSVAQASVMVQSNISGADIEVDGDFVGSTPSTISLSPGQHSIVVKKKGYQDWKRTVNASGSGVNINAELDPVPEN